MDNVIATIIKFVTTGGDSAANQIKGVNNAATVATKGMTTLATSLGSMSGKLGSAASQVANFIFSVKQMGAVGGIIAGAQMAITLLSQKFCEAVDKMAEAAERQGERIRSKLDKINKARMDDVAKALDLATTKAKESAAAFDALASSYMKVQSAKDATVKSGFGAAASALNLEKSKAMSGAKDDNELAVVGAGYDVRIAEASAKAIRDEQDRSLEAAKDEADIKAKQANEAARVEKASLRAYEKAKAVYNEDVNTNNDGNIGKSKSTMEAAYKAYRESVNATVRANAEADAAEERVIQAQNARTAAINDSTRAIVEARDAERRLIDAQKASAQAEIDRLKATEKAVKVNGGEGTRRPTGQPTADYASKFEAAFDLWRDPEAAAAAVESDKKRSADLKAFDKAVNRYGGKGKIDEYAALMRAGDEEGMQSRLDQWRKSSKFTPQVEQMVKAEAARQNENAADRALANIEKNTANLDKKLDQLLSIK